MNQGKKYYTKVHRQPTWNWQTPVPENETGRQPAPLYKRKIVVQIKELWKFADRMTLVGALIVCRDAWHLQVVYARFFTKKRMTQYFFLNRDDFGTLCSKCHPSPGCFWINSIIGYRSSTIVWDVVSHSLLILCGRINMSVDLPCVPKAFGTCLKCFNALNHIFSQK